MGSFDSKDHSQKRMIFSAPDDSCQFVSPSLFLYGDQLFNERCRFFQAE